MPKAKSTKKATAWSFLVSPRFAAVCGILGPLVGFGSIGVSVALSVSWFNWFLHALSDLGNPVMLGGFHGISGWNPAAPVFNGGMFATGVLTTFLGLQLFLIQQRQKSSLGMAGGILFMIAMLCLAGVGIFHEMLLLGHIITAAGFFFMTAAASIVYGVALLRGVKSRLLGSLTLAMGIIILGTLLAMLGRLFPFPGASIPEMIVALAAFAWVVPFSVRLYLDAAKPKSACPMRRLVPSSRVAAIAGIVGPLTAFIGIAVAIVMSASWFNWVTNALSDLGHPYMLGGSHGTPGANPAAPLFNGSLIVCGFITLPLAVRLIVLQRDLKSVLGVLGGILLIVAETFLIGIGIFNESAGDIHFWVSVGFFVNILLFGLVYGVLMMGTRKTRPFGVYTFILAFVSAAIWIVYFAPFAPWSGPAIPEVFSAVATLAWVFPLCIRLYRQGAH